MDYKHLRRLNNRRQYRQLTVKRERTLTTIYVIAILMILSWILMLLFKQPEVKPKLLPTTNTATCPAKQQQKPKFEEIKGKEIGLRTVTAYNSLEEQTDSRPCEASDQSDICERYRKGECIIATNEFKNGTKLALNTFGECSVADKTNRKYRYRIDVFMGEDKERAIKFGKQQLAVKLITN